MNPQTLFSLLTCHSWFDTQVLMKSWDSKFSFLIFFEIRNYQWVYGKLRLYILKSCACKVDNFWGCSLVSFLKKSILHSANITALNGDNILVATDKDWYTGGVKAPCKILLCYMPYLIDNKLSPDGHQVIHACVPATETYEDWEGINWYSEEYGEKKR